LLPVLRIFFVAGYRAPSGLTGSAG